MRNAKGSEQLILMCLKSTLLFAHGPPCATNSLHFILPKVLKFW